MALSRQGLYHLGMSKRETCPKCGAVYEVTEIKLIQRDRDSYECGCGYTLDRWNGSRIPQYRLIEPGKSKDA